MTPALFLAAGILASIACNIAGAFWLRHWLRREIAEHARHTEAMAEGVERLNAASDRYGEARLRLDEAYVRATLTDLYNLGADPEERREAFRVVEGRTAGGREDAA